MSKQNQTHDWIHTTLLSLRIGDEVIINDRQRSLTLVERFWDDRESGYWRYRFEGYGTHYDGIVGPADGDHISTFRTPGSRDVYISSIERVDTDDVIVCDTNAAEWLDKFGIDVR